LIICQIFQLYDEKKERKNLDELFSKYQQ
jgi:hypothetical protein